MKPSTASVLALLRARGSLGVTPHDAAQIGCWRLAARVYELRAEGYRITDEGKGFARYVLVEAEQLAAFG